MSATPKEAKAEAAKVATRPKGQSLRLPRRFTFDRQDLEESKDSAKPPQQVCHWTKFPRLDIDLFDKSKLGEIFERHVE